MIRFIIELSALCLVALVFREDWQHIQADLLRARSITAKKAAAQAKANPKIMNAAPPDNPCTGDTPVAGSTTPLNP